MTGGSAPDPVFRKATPEDAQALTGLAFRSKAHWGYPMEWMELWREELAVSPEYVARHEVVVASLDGELAGFYGLELHGATAWLEHLWVAPERIGTGLGRRLFEHARAAAAAGGCEALELLADPNAEAFYRRMGAVTTGEERGEVLGTERALPRMRVDLAAASL